MSKLINCKNCGSSLIKNTDTCPGCGAKVKRKSVLTWIAAIFIGFIVLSAVMAGMSGEVSENDTASEEVPRPTDQVASSSLVGNTNTEVVSETEVITSSWDYDESIDEMRGTTTYTAISMSENNVYLESPYSGGTNLGIIIRHSDELGNEVLVVTNNGQLWCEYSNCIMTVKFDDKSIEQYSISRAAGGSSEAMFLDGSEDEFINQLKKSKKTMIEIGFFNNGNQQFKFDVSDLEWRH